MLDGVWLLQKFFLIKLSMLFGTGVYLLKDIPNLSFSSFALERANCSKTNTGTFSKAALGKILRDRMERIWAFPSALDTILN